MPVLTVSLIVNIWMEGVLTFKALMIIRTFWTSQYLWVNSVSCWINNLVVYLQAWNSCWMCFWKVILFWQIPAFPWLSSGRCQMHMFAFYFYLNNCYLQHRLWSCKLNYIIITVISLKIKSEASPIKVQSQCLFFFFFFFCTNSTCSQTDKWCHFCDDICVVVMNVLWFPRQWKHKPALAPAHN